MLFIWERRGLAGMLALAALVALALFTSPLWRGDAPIARSRDAVHALSASDVAFYPSGRPGRVPAPIRRGVDLRFTPYAFDPDGQRAP